MKEQDIQLIEAYLEGTLQGEERSRFEERLGQEEDLAAELALFQEVEMRLEAYQKEQKKSEWKDLLAENEGTKPKLKSLRSVYYAVGVAASVLLLVGIWWMWLRPIPPAVLADNYWEKTANFAYTDEIRSTDPSTNTSLSEQLKSAYDRFESADYAGTLSILNSLTPPTDESLLLTGASFFLMEDFESARTTFQKILDNPQYQANDEASWYLALTHLKLNEKTAARKLLEDIVQKGSWNHQSASKLLPKI